MPALARSFLVLVLALLVDAGLASSAHADRLLLKDGGIQAMVPNGDAWCGERAAIVLWAGDAEAFTDSAHIEKLLGGLRAALSFECSQAQSVILVGAINGKPTPIYKATAAAADGWKLKVALAPQRVAAPAATAPAEQSAPPQQPAPAQQPAPPQQAAPAPETIKAQPNPVAPVSAAPPPPPHIDEPTGSSLRLWPLALLAVVVAVVLLLLWLWRRRKPGKPARDTDAPPARTPPPVVRAKEKPIEKARPPARVSAPPPVPPPAVADNPKGQLLAEQKYKYQAAVNAALDELTRTQVELQQFAALPETLRTELRRIGGALPKDVRALVRRRQGSWPRALLGALWLRGLLRGVWKLPGLLKFVGAFLAIAGALRLAGLAAAGHYLIAALVYLALFGLALWLERRAQMKAGSEVLDAAAAVLKLPLLHYAYANQNPKLDSGYALYRGFAVTADTEKQLPLDISIRPYGSDTKIGLGQITLHFGDMASYRLPDSGEILFLGAKPGSEFMRGYGDALNQALAEYGDELSQLGRQLHEYGVLRSRERAQREDIPRLEKLVQSVERLEQIWRPVSIDAKAFDFVLRRVDLFNLRDKATPLGILLYGYRGNGKEFLARKIAESTFAKFVKVSAVDMSQAKDVRQLWAQCRDETNAVVLYIDYADQVFPKPGSDSEGASRETLLAWLEEWTRSDIAHGNVWVVMSAQSDQALHPNVLAQFGSSKIEIGAPAAANRPLILRNACLDNQMPANVPAWVAETTGGASIRELRDIVKETKLHSMPNPPTDAHWREAIKNVRGTEAGLKDERKTWDRLVLPTEIKEQLQRVARILREADRYKEKGVSVPNVLLFGPPGTGKTDIARTFANEGGVKFMAATTADLKAGYIGQSAHLVRDLFAKARASAPCILFIDEIETVAAKRGTGDSFSQEIVTEMLAQMDGAQKAADRQVFVLAATNRPEDIDAAILSRFTSKIEIPLPDEAGRREMLKRLLAERMLDPALDIAEVSAYLAKRTNRKSGRDLVSLIARAMERAVMEADSPDDVKLTRGLLLAEVAPQGGRQLSEQEIQAAWSRIVLKPDIKESIIGKIRMFNSGDKAAPRGMLLYGPPGTGKTEIARRIADSAGCYFMPLSIPDLKAGHTGQSGQNVRKVWEQARSRGRCVIFVDECEGVFARRGSTNADAFSDEIVQAFLAEWDGVASEGQQVWMVGATNRRDLLDDAVVSRFGAAIEIGMPEAAERVQILRLEMEKLERSADVPEFVGKQTGGFSGRNLAMMARDVCTLAAEQGGAITEAVWRAALARHAQANVEAVDESARWNSLILAEDTLEKLKTTCEALRHIEVLQKQGFEVPRGALLYGPPGTGKTQIARTLANESGLAFIAATTADIKAGYVGQSGQKTRELFERARGKAPCILFIDEIESVVPARGGAGSDQFTGEIVTQMLQELDGVKKTDRHVFLLAATNRPEDVDPAIRSRFGDEIEVPNPDFAQRRQLFDLFLRKQKNIDFDVAAMAEQLALKAGNVGGRDIRNIVQRASQRAMQRALKAGTPDRVQLAGDDLLAELGGA